MKNFSAFSQCHTNCWYTRVNYFLYIHIAKIFFYAYRIFSIVNTKYQIMNRKFDFLNE